MRTHGSFYVVDLTIGEVTPLIEQESVNSLYVAFSADGETLAANCYSFEEDIRIWRLSTGEELDPVTFERRGGSAIAFMPGGHLAAMGSRGRILVYDVTSKEKLREIDVGRHISDMSFSPDGRLGVLVNTSASNGQGAVILWDMQADRAFRDLVGPGVRIERAAFSPTGDVVFTAPRDRRLLAWHARSGQGLYELGLAADERGPGPGAFAIAPDGSVLATAHEEDVVFRDPLTGVETGRWSDGDGHVMSLAFSPDGGRLVCLLRHYGTNADGRVRAVRGVMSLSIEGSSARDRKSATFC